MDNTYRKKRYSKNSAYMRSRRNKKEDNFSKNVTQQIIICGIIFLVILGLKNVNTPITNAVINQIKTVLGYTVDVNNAYKSVETFAGNVGLLGTNDDDKRQGEVSEQSNASEVSNEQATQTSNNSLDGQLSFDKLEQPAVKAQNNIIKINQEIMPPLDGIVTSTFGTRKHPLYEKELFHYGIDIDGEKGEEILAAISGEVIEIGNNDSYGKYVRLRHEEEIYTFYAHCDVISVKEGRYVEKGDVIGRVGNSGAVLGEHLHFEIWKKDMALDPMQYISLPLHLSSEGGES